MKNFGRESRFLLKTREGGRAHAINLALGNCSGEIVVITDGPALYDKNTLFHLVAPFISPCIGGVSVLYEIPSSNENQITALEKTFWSYKEKLRALESKAYSTSWLSGEACSFRRGIINRADEDSLADDSNVALQLVAKGYRLIVNPNSRFIEKSPSQVDDFLTVKVRRALGGLQEVVRFRSFLFNRRYGHFGLVIFPYRFYSQILSPLAIFVALILLVPVGLEIGRHIGIYLTAVAAVVAIVFMFLFRRMVLTCLYMELVMLTALLLSFNRRMSLRWARSKTTRS